MGWGSYLVDKKNKIKFYLHKTNIDKFLNDVDIIKRAIEKLYNLNDYIDYYNYDITDTKVKNLNLNILSILVDNYKTTITLSDYNAYDLMVVLYYLSISITRDTDNLDSNFDFYTEFEKDKSKKYKDYKLINNHDY